MTEIVIPTEAQLADRLSGLERLMTAKAWERAAIVWAFTRDDSRGGRPSAETTSEVRRFPMPIAEFARQGFYGLKSENSVAHYRQAWDDAMTAGYACSSHPGDAVELPDPHEHPFPPSRSSKEGQRTDLYGVAHEYGITTGSGLRDALANVTPERTYPSQTSDPADRAERVRREMADPAVRREVTRQDVAHARQSFTAAGIRPQPTSPEHVETTSHLAALDLAAQARRALRAATDALADVAIDSEMRSALSDRADSIERALMAFRQAISGDVDDALARLLAEEDAR